MTRYQKVGTEQEEKKGRHTRKITYILTSDETIILKA